MKGWPGKIIDVQVAAQLVNETERLTLAHRGKIDAGLHALDEYEAQIARARGKARISGMHPAEVTDYAVGDAWAPCVLWSRYAPLLQDTGEGQLWEIMQVEAEITPLLWRMQHRGVLCDEQLLAAGVAACTDRTDMLAGEIREILNDPHLKVGNAKRLQELLRMDSTGESALRASSHPAAAPVLQWRAYQKLRGSSFGALLEWADKAPDGRLHPCLN